jgi:hypothetical protein
MAKTKSEETTALQQYASFDIETFTQGRIEEEENVESFDNVFLKLPQGTTVMRVLPPPVAWDDYFKARNTKPSPFIGYHRHMYKTPGGEFISYVCPKKTTLPGQKGRHCPDCQADYLARTEGSELDKEEAKEYKTKYKMACNVYIRSCTDPKFKDVDQVKVLEMSALSPYHRKKLREDGSALTLRTLFEKLEAAFTPRPGKKAKNVVDPGPKGFDIIVTKAGSGRYDTTYTIEICDDPCALHEDAKRMAEILSSQIDLRQTLSPATKEEIAVIEQRKGVEPKEPAVTQVKTDVSEFINTTVVTEEDDELGF